MATSEINTHLQLRATYHCDSLEDIVKNCVDAYLDKRFEIVNLIKDSSDEPRISV